MSFVQAKCPHCSGMLAVDTQRDVWVCELCGEPFIVSRAVEFFNSGDSGQGISGNPDFVIRKGVVRKYSSDNTDVHIPESATVIGKDCFRNCVDIVSVHIPETVRSIESFAFYGCIRLTEVTLPESIRHIGESAFDGCSRLVSVELPSGLNGEFRADIGRNAFAGCSNLVSVTVSDRIKALPHDIFSNCSEYVNFRWKNLRDNINCCDVVRERSLAGRCIYCGGKLKGVFRRKCLSCGESA